MLNKYDLPDMDTESARFWRWQHKDFRRRYHCCNPECIDPKSCYSLTYMHPSYRHSLHPEIKNDSMNSFLNWLLTLQKQMGFSHPLQPLRQSVWHGHARIIDLVLPGSSFITALTFNTSIGGSIAIHKTIGRATGWNTLQILIIA